MAELFPPIQGGRGTGTRTRSAHLRTVPPPQPSDRLELLERLAAASAVAQRAAWRRAEDVLQRRVARAAVGQRKPFAWRSCARVPVLLGRSAHNARHGGPSPHRKAFVCRGVLGQYCPPRDPLETAGFSCASNAPRYGKGRSWQQNGNIRARLGRGDVRNERIEAPGRGKRQSPIVLGALSL
jgi:hypothetical protein